jgi:hypothetical protein
VTKRYFFHLYDANIFLETSNIAAQLWRPAPDSLTMHLFIEEEKKEKNLIRIFMEFI